MLHDLLAEVNALVAQLDRVSDYESEGQGFESLQARQSRAPHAKCVWGFYFIMV